MRHRLSSIPDLMARPRKTDQRAPSFDLACDDRVVHVEAVRRARATLPTGTVLAGLADVFAALGDPTRLRIVAALAAAGAGPEHLVRLTWFITDRHAYLDARRALGTAYREVIGRHYPAMSVVVVQGLLEDGAKVEIEATAIVPA